MQSRSKEHPYLALSWRGMCGREKANRKSSMTLPLRGLEEELEDAVHQLFPQGPEGMRKAGGKEKKA